jgi:hypothetical protein
MIIIIIEIIIINIIIIIIMIGNIIIIGIKDIKAENVTDFQKYRAKALLDLAMGHLQSI